MSLPLTEIQFTTFKQNRFKESVSNAAFVAFADVAIDKIEPIAGGMNTYHI